MRKQIRARRIREAIRHAPSLSCIPIARSAGVLKQVRVRNPAQHAWDKETSLSQPSPQGIGSSLSSVDEGRQVDEHGDTLTRARRAYAAQDWRSAAGAEAARLRSEVWSVSGW